MSCDNLTIPKPLTTQCLTDLFGIPYGTAGRVVAGTPYSVSGIVLHCYADTVAGLCNEMKCRTRSSVISGSYENSFHYGVGAAASSGPVRQFVNDNDISWTFGTYKNNTYATVPPPNISINWPVLQGEHGINTTPDVYTIDIALAIGHIVDATQSGCYTCPTSSGLEQTQHDQLVQLLAYLAQEYDIPIDADHITFHDLIHCGEGQECACTDIAELLASVAAFCPPCDQEAFTATEVDPTDEVLFIYGATEPCCPSSPGCLVQIPWNSCFIGDLAVDGTLDSYILGLAQDPITMQWCLTRGCLAVQTPLIGCGTVDDPLRLDTCLADLVEEADPVDFVTLVGTNAEGCLIDAPIADVMLLYETPITPIDTDTIDLTVSGQSDHTLQVDVKISAEANNQMEVRPDGLFVDFTCIDFVDAYPEDDIAVFIGQNGAGDCVHQDLVDTVSNGICLVPEDNEAIPTWILGKTQAECPVFVEVGNIVAAGLVANDTTTVDLTLTGNVLTADAIISPDADNILVDSNGLYVPDITVSDGFCIHMNYNPVTRNINSELIVAPHLPDNIFQCIPGAPGSSGAYVQDLAVVDSNCIDLTYANRELTADVVVDPAADNILECNANGLFVPLSGGVTVSDTDCLNLTLAGGVLSGVLTLAPTQGIIPNAIDCIAGQGLYVPQGAGLTVTDTNCIDLTIANGNLTATLVVNPSGDNQFECGVGGAYVPIGAGLIANDTDCVNHNLVGGVLSTTLNIAGPQGGVPNVLSCVAGQGLYVPESHIGVVDTTCIDLTFTGGILRADIIIDPTGDNQVQCLPAGLYVPPAAGLQAVDTDCITLNLAGDTLTSTPIIAPAQGGIDNALSCVPGEGLYVPTSLADYIVSVQDTNCIELDVTGGSLSASPVIAPTQGGVENALDCLVDGLYVPLVDLCSLGNLIAVETPTTVWEDNFVIVDQATGCLVRGDRLHNLTAATLPAGENEANGYTVNSRWRVPSGTFPGQTRDIEYVYTKSPFFPWQKISGGTQIGARGAPPNENIPAGLNSVPDLICIDFDVLGELSLASDDMTSLAGGNQQTHLAAQLTFPTPPAGDLVVEMGILVNGFTSFSPIIQRYHNFTGGETINITGTTQIYTVSPGQVVEAYINHNAGGDAVLSSWVVNHAEITTEI